MHPEHPDPEAEAELLWMRQPGIKGIELHGHGTWTLQRYVWGISRVYEICFITTWHIYSIPFQKKEVIFIQY